jgi:tetratricopeptide (TPR) repeat protein
MGTGALITALVFAWGIRRYGNAEDFCRRLYSEVEARRPHPQFAPTPLAHEAFPGNAAAGTDSTESPAALLEDLIPSPAPRATLMPDAGSRQASAAIFVPVESELQQRPAAREARVAVSSPTPTPGPPAAGLLPRVQLSGLRHYWQTWNNCGPATLAMNMSYFGSKLSQADVAAALRPYRDDKNVSPDEMAAYARARGLQAIVRVNGDAGRLKRLLSAGVPVLLETWYEPKPNDGMGHYRLLVGYDDAAREWIAYDSYDGRGLDKSQPYAGIRLPYDEVARLWEAFNRTYVVLYDETRAAAVEGILATDLEDATMLAAALEKARVTALDQPRNAFAWFNAGSTLVALERYEDAAQMYDRARRIGLPWRMMWYQFGPFEAYYETGQYDEIISLADATLRNAQIEELYYWRGLAQQAVGDADAARESWRRAVELNRHFAPAHEALQALDTPPS